MKLQNIFLYIEYHVHYIRWCLRYPRLFAHYCNIGQGSCLQIDPKARLHFGRAVYFSRHFTGDFYGKVMIGNDVSFQHDCHISAHEEVTIGDHSIFAEGVSIHDENHVVTAGSDPIIERGFITKPVHIGRNVWVGAKVTIVAGVHIGDNAVIGANAVVTHDVPAYTVVGGIPARIIREIKPSVDKVF